METLHQVSCFMVRFSGLLFCLFKLLIITPLLCVSEGCGVVLVMLCAKILWRVLWIGSISFFFQLIYESLIISAFSSLYRSVIVAPKKAGVMPSPGTSTPVLATASGSVSGGTPIDSVSVVSSSDASQSTSADSAACKHTNTKPDCSIGRAARAAKSQGGWVCWGESQYLFRDRASLYVWWNNGVCTV